MIATAETMLTQQHASITVTMESPFSPIQYKWLTCNKAATSSPMPSEKDIYDTYVKLKYSNPAVLEIAYDILVECKLMDKIDIKISYTGDKEILIYRKQAGEYRNIIIDEDGYIEYLCIPEDRSKTYNEYYPFIGTINPKELASKL